MTHTDSTHDHDLGFSHDLPKMLGRRRFLALGAGLAGTAFAGPALAQAAQCVALPWETAGPYPGDGSNVKNGQTVNALTQEGVIRTDLRTCFGDYDGVAEGLPLELELDLVDADGCRPLAGAAIYIWHCDVLGKYSLYDLTEVNFLRGVGVADDAGKVRFTTIVPGCYDGRWPHIHFEVFENVDAAVSGEASVLTAQIALPQEISAEVYATNALYSNGTKNLGRISLDTDNVFSDNTAEQVAQQMLAMSGDVETGYTGTVTIPIDFHADRTVSMAPPPGGGGLFGLFGKGKE